VGWGTTDLSSPKQDRGYISFDSLERFIFIPSGLDSFKQTHYKIQGVHRNECSKIKPLIRMHNGYLLYVTFTKVYELKYSPHCGAPLHGNGSVTPKLRHIPSGDSYSLVRLIGLVSFVPAKNADTVKFVLFLSRYHGI
jgi:hypothetical protein